MKKFLSLVLALVMTMSLVTVSAGAKEFTDDSKITYDEAVAVISAVGVVDGYTDGSFNPTNQLTRGAAAKIICNLILGPTTASALSADAAPFSDVPTTNEFTGYIAYCSQQGIINGYNDGTFRPAGSLTGYAFLKMLLGALGYDGEVEGFTGPNWSIQVGKLALGIGLTKGNDEFVGTEYVNREEACLYAFNTLKADMVEYDAKTSVSVGGAEVVIAGSKAQVCAQGVYDDTMGEAGLQFAEKYFPKLTKTKNDTDAFGRPANEWKYKAEVIGSFADDSTLLETYTTKVSRGDLYSLIGSSVVNGLDDGDYDFTVYVDGASVSKPSVSNYFVKSSSTAAGAKDSVKGTGVSGNGVLTEVYMDDDNNVTIVMVNTWLVKATADYNSTKESLSIETVEINTDDDSTTDGNVITVPSLGTTIDNEDVYVADFKEDDYILVTYSYDTKAIESAVAAEVVTGEVSEFTELTEVIMDGTTYKYNKLVGSTESRTEYTIGEDAKVVLDAYGYIIYIDEALSTSSYAFVKETAKATGVGNKVAADIYFTDGTNDSVILKKVAGETDFDSKKDAQGYWWTFSKDSNNEYTLNSIKAPLTSAEGKVSTSGQKILSNDTVKFLSNLTTTDSNITIGTNESAVITDIKGNSATVFVVVEADGDVTSYTGVANAPDITTSDSINDDVIVDVVYKQSTGYAEYVFVDLSNDADAKVEDSNTAADYLFLLKYTGNKTTSGEDTYYKYKVVYDGVETEKYVESSLADSDSAGMLFRDVKENAKGYVTGAKPFGGNAQGTVDKRDEFNMTISGNSQITFSNDTMTIAGNDYIIGDKCNVTLALGKNANLDLVNEGDDYTLYQTSARSAANLLKGYKLTGTAYVAVDDNASEVATDIYIWVSKAEATEGAGGGTSEGDAGKFTYSVGVANNGTATINVSNFVWPSDSKEYNAAKISMDLVDADKNYISTVSLTLDKGQTSGRIVETGTGYVSGDKLDITNVTVSYSELQSIAVTMDPSKLTYTAGESFDATDMVVTATYAFADSTGSNTATVTGYTVDKTVLAVADNGQNVTVTFGGKTAKTSCALTVNARTTVEVSLTSETLEMGASDLNSTIKASVDTSVGATLTSAEVTATSGSDSSYAKISVHMAEDGTLTITTTGATSADTYTITVTGTAEDGSTTDTIELVVTIA